MTLRPKLLLTALASAAALANASCIGDIDGEAAPPAQQKPGGKQTPPPRSDDTMKPAPDPSAAPYEPLPPRVYGAKVKDLMTGLALTDDELKTLTADPKSLKKLIDGWMATDQFRAKAFEFFKNAFQQTQLTVSDLDDQLRLTSAGASGTDQKKFLRSVEEMFAHTVMKMIDEGRPFNETATTNTFMLNVPLMVALSYMDAAPQDDAGRAVSAGYWILNKFGAKTFQYVQTTNTDPVTGVATPIPFEESIDPQSPNFMRFQFNQPDPEKYMPCKDPIVVTGTSAVNAVFRAMFGSRQSCNGASPMPTLYTDADWNTWRKVTIRAPKAGEERTLFWDLPKLRDPNTTELVLETPRVGFFTTLAFFANWPTNPSNQYRVTTNQALIVGLGRSFDDRATIAQVMETSVDALHVEPGTVCYACHQVLDPMRDFFKQSYSLTYFKQLSPLNPKSPPLPVEGAFSLDGSPMMKGVGVQTFGRAIAEHPEFARAWTQKLCQQANASLCLPDDPEFVRVANAFKASKFDWRTLVRELYSSPLVTFAAKTKTTEKNGVVMGIARRESLCDRLGARLGLNDVCNRKGEATLTRIPGKMKNLSLGVPGSAYSRADEVPVTPHDSNLFFVSATEKMCMELAGQLVEANAMSPWRSAAKDAALADFVRVVMGVSPGDPRSPALLGVLTRHHDAAVAAKEKPADALRSAFTLACSSPIATSMGL